MREVVSFRRSNFDIAASNRRIKSSAGRRDRGANAARWQCKLARQFPECRKGPGYNEDWQRLARDRRSSDKPREAGRTQMKGETSK